MRAIRGRFGRGGGPLVTRPLVVQPEDRRLAGAAGPRSGDGRLRGAAAGPEGGQAIPLLPLRMPPVNRDGTATGLSAAFPPGGACESGLSAETRRPGGRCRSSRFSGLRGNRVLHVGATCLLPRLVQAFLPGEGGGSRPGTPKGEGRFGLPARFRHEGVGKRPLSALRADAPLGIPAPAGDCAAVRPPISGASGTRPSRTRAGFDEDLSPRCRVHRNGAERCSPRPDGHFPGRSRPGFP